MTSRKARTESPLQLLDETAGWLAGGGILTMALFPLSLPLLLLTLASVLPLLIIPLALGLVAAAIAGPIVLARAISRRLIRAGRGTRRHARVALEDRTRLTPTFYSPQPSPRRRD